MKYFLEKHLAFIFVMVAMSFIFAFMVISRYELVGVIESPINVGTQQQTKTQTGNQHLTSNAVNTAILLGIESYRPKIYTTPEEDFFSMSAIEDSK